MRYLLSSSIVPPPLPLGGRLPRLGATPSFYNDFEDFDERNSGDDDNGDEDTDDDDEYLNVDSLGDWRELRRKLLMTMENSDSDGDEEEALPSSSASSTTNPSQRSEDQGRDAASSISGRNDFCPDNAALLETQCESLAKEYRDKAWAHPTPTVRLWTFLFVIMSRY
jgi:hypothetical protein